MCIGNLLKIDFSDCISNLIAQIGQKKRKYYTSYTIRIDLRPAAYLGFVLSIHYVP